MAYRLRGDGQDLSLAQATSFLRGTIERLINLVDELLYKKLLRHVTGWMRGDQDNAKASAWAAGFKLDQKAAEAYHRGAY